MRSDAASFEDDNARAGSARADNNAPAQNLMASRRVK
jgi:hypothetical protein